jgi:mRNA-degrading endonuclease RelE of RelBE toxin-antitoxin system
MRSSDGNPLGRFLEIPYEQLDERNLAAKTDRLAGMDPESIRESRVKALTDEKGIKVVTVCFTDLAGRFRMLDCDQKFLLKTGGDRPAGVAGVSDTARDARPHPRIRRCSRCKRGRPPSSIISKTMLHSLTPPQSRPAARRGGGLWRYRVGGYRILCELHDNELIVPAVAIGHRSQGCRKPWQRHAISLCCGSPTR